MIYGSLLLSKHFHNSCLEFRQEENYKLIIICPTQRRALQPWRPILTLSNVDLIILACFGCKSVCALHKPLLFCNIVQPKLANRPTRNTAHNFITGLHDAQPSRAPCILAPSATANRRPCFSPRYSSTDQ